MGAMRSLVLVPCLVVSFLLAQPAWAQGWDASLPDASVDEGGDGRTSEESDTSSSPCLADRDCDRGFKCRDRACVYQRFRDAEFTGCGTAGAAVVAPLAALAWRRRRRARS
jgi:uncharacterized protein (TIGR03382 family)